MKSKLQEFIRLAILDNELQIEQVSRLVDKLFGKGGKYFSLFLYRDFKVLPVKFLKTLSKFLQIDYKVLVDNFENTDEDLYPIIRERIKLLKEKYLSDNQEGGDNL